MRYDRPLQKCQNFMRRENRGFFLPLIQPQQKRQQRPSGQNQFEHRIGSEIPRLSPCVQHQARNSRQAASSHGALTRQHGKLQHQNRSSRSRDGKQRLRNPDG
jgi:hypothetical protein